MKRLSAIIVAVAMCAIATSAAAQADMGFKGAGLEIGIVSPQDIDATFGVGVFADWGTMMPQLALESYFDFWAKTQSMSPYGEAYARDTVLGARAKYLFPMQNTPIQPFVGGGLGMHFLYAEVTVPDQTIGGIFFPGASYDDSNVKLGLDLGGGIMGDISPNAYLMGEMWYTVVSDVNQLSVKFGLGYRI